MIKHNEKLVSVILKKNEETFIELDRIYPLGNIDYKGELKILLSYENKKYFSYKVEGNSFDNETARYLKITSSIDQEITIYMGLGYYVEKNLEMTSLFERAHGWNGGDGIYSFNLEREKDYNQQNDRTLFVFGDTFVGHARKDKVRIEPTAFVNNSFGYYQNGKIDFEIARNEYHALVSLFEPDRRMQVKGYNAKNLVRYHGDIRVRPYASSLDPNHDIELKFDFNEVHHIVKVDIENFHDTPRFGAIDIEMGVRELEIYSSIDDKEYQFIGKYNLSLYSEENPLNSIELNVDAEFIKFVIRIENNQTEEQMVGLRKVYFYSKKGMLFDVLCTTNSEFAYDEEKPYSWFWLQDGVMYNNKFYIYPCIIEHDHNGIEGFEFKIKGVARLEMDVIDGKVDYQNVEMKEAPLYRLVGDKEYILPIAIYSEDEYCYFYGYYNERSIFMRNLIVGRIKKTHLHDLNHLEYFDGENWDKDFTKAKSLIQHVSCEMSVQKIVEGENKGKYLAIFQYDTNGPKVAYSIGETPYGPFTKPYIIYHTPEVDDYNPGTTYTYNAKAHLHLSSPRKILVSYNCNDMSMKKNKEDYTIYHPRFINFIDTSND